MRRPQSNRVLVLALAATLASPAVAQLGRTHPGQGYFAALDELHSGDLRRAERQMRTELRTAVKTIDSRWVDSIIYSSGLGEALYQQGRLAESLEQFDLSLDLFLDQAAWLNTVRFQQKPREATNLARRQPVWARPSRAVTYADMPRSFLVQYGQVNNSQVAAQGGVVRQAQYWKLDAEELARSIAWTLYRRSQLLGSLGAYDARTSAALNRISGGGLGPGGHWSTAWTELWWALAAAGAGDANQAAPHLDQALLLGGRYDHRLTGLAWLARGRLAAGAGDAGRASRAFSEAVASAVTYEQFDVLTEATRAWHEVATVSAKATSPPLVQIADWSERRSMWLPSVAARLGLIERAVLAGENASARGALGQAFRRARDVSNGLLGREGDRLLALAVSDGPRDEAIAMARQAMSAQSAMSRRRLQVRIASAWFDQRSLTPRSAREAFAGLLEDPSPMSWFTTPLDALSWMAAPETDAFDRWFAAALERREALLAMRVIDRQRRREVFSGQALSGRLAATRWLLEAPDGALPLGAAEPRARLDAAAPAYRMLRQEGLVARDKLRAAVAALEGSVTPAVRKAVAELRETIEARERLIVRIALTRSSTPLVFPPPIDPLGAKQQMTAGEALVAFHETGGDLYGVVLTAAGEHLWRIGPAGSVDKQVERLLREVVGTSPKQAWSVAQFDEASWIEPAATLGETLFADSRLDAATLERLWIVPVGSLWRVPFDVLPLPGEGEPGESEEPKRLGEVVTTVAPTPGWAVRPRASREAGEQAIWLLAAGSTKQAAFEGGDPVTAHTSATPPPPGLEPSSWMTKSLASAALIDLGDQPLRANPLGAELTTSEVGSREVASWSRLPFGGVTDVALVGGAGGEAGGGRVRRSKNAPSVGAAELHAVCAVLSGGTQTLLLDRWPTRGARARDFVGEWLNGVGRLEPADAWRRSLALGRTRPLEVQREPRLAIEAGDSPTAEHPFWWSGYLLVD
ncbi:hypothetical protein MalM25_10160 [Planctomycetes bacterium MalM25]|nr:hypothetical protein MalM25_10160 [Planctomycetes bacterium MalM25]